MTKPLVIGIAGGSGSGKTTIADELLKRLGIDTATKITHDSYYRNLDHLPFEERCKVNFDHPGTLETELMVEHLKKVRDGEAVEVPMYDFSMHTRKKETRLVNPTSVIIVEGIMIFFHQELRELMDIKVFIDTDADIRFIRRLRRDTKSRGRTAEEIAERYLADVRPMHVQFVEPTKRFADVIIPEGGYDSHVAMNMLVAHLQTHSAVEKVKNS
mmetsp:Transcript_12941/g.20945  ORF Transcript_12941/g.20945 Transcript_12941/m.20945 type:complete len:214 (-) Transcript_12941:854-1495(-)|eukprot:CAMPEP_0203775190 /NCGR_PEP_ID=MMETSP0099_2-20121227/5897_1 /ASSEMBLY_ACC=CAM_ASM_000209 /TAXON_ID=96639 /ORGANISM=" , Strain NY0313808BC1" /LENGTH=213 /DNA_ID=CAMNT_0050673747 /DNA_START=191 /DNA_END=832 /DNA_ORIENTATION=-